MRATHSSEWHYALDRQAADSRWISGIVLISRVRGYPSTKQPIDKKAAPKGSYLHC